MSSLPARRFLPVLAAAAIVILLHQASDLSAGLIGTDLRLPASRIRLVSTIGTRGAALLCSDILLVWAALGLSHSRALRALGALHYAGGALALLAVPLFVLDAGRMASTVAAVEMSTYRMVVLRTLILLLAAGAGAVVAAAQLSGLGRRPATPS